MSSFYDILFTVVLLVCYGSQQTKSFRGAPADDNAIANIMNNQVEIKRIMKDTRRQMEERLQRVQEDQFNIKQEISDIKEIINNMAHVVTNTEPACKSPFVSIDGGSTCYYFSPSIAAWQTAREACQALDPLGDLAQLPTLEQQKALQEYMAEHGMTGEFGLYYIGATDVGSPRKFKWNSGEPVTEGWRSEEPNHTHPGNGCLWFYEGQIGDASYSCSGSYKYICQI